MVGGSRHSINSSMKFTIRLTDMYQRWVRPLLKRHFLRASASDLARAVFRTRITHDRTEALTIPHL